MVKEEDDVSDSESEYDSNEDDVVSSDGDDSSHDESEDFEDQGSSDDDDDDYANDDSEPESDEELVRLPLVENAPPRQWQKRQLDERDGTAVSTWLHTDDLSSDDEDADGTRNRIGRVPLHWYDEHDHLGYDGLGRKVAKGDRDGDGDLLDRVLRQDDRSGPLMVHDALQGKDVPVSARQMELLRRVQAGAYAHPEFDGNAEGTDYFSSVRETSGLHQDKYEPKRRFQPSKWEKLMVRRLLFRLKCGSIDMDYLKGKVRDMNDYVKKESDDQPFLLWRGDEEDELNMRGKGPQHIPAPKTKPPGHAESYRPPPEYLPTPEDLAAWAELDVPDRPHGLLVPTSHDRLRHVGAYEHSVRERFERCMDLYLCPRAMKRKLNIDPESLVPSIPKPQDLRPFPTTRCVQYCTPSDSDDEVVIRSLTVSPDGQYLASGADDGYMRLWEVQTGRLLRSWNLSTLVAGIMEKQKKKGEQDSKEEEKDDKSEENDDDKQDSSKRPHPIVSLQWNPTHHIVLAAVGHCAVVVNMGTGGSNDSELTEALLTPRNPPSQNNQIAVDWIWSQDDDSTSNTLVWHFTSETTYVTWHHRGDYACTLSPRAKSGAFVMVHQLSKGRSQQPFRKPFKSGPPQAVAFHPKRPFLFVATPTDVRVYHLVKAHLIKRLRTGCKHVSCIRVHPGTGDHLLLGSLDRRVVWFDLDLGETPYKTLRYHERAVRAVDYHGKCPLMASAADDGTVHVFHCTVYADDLTKNPLLVPVKVLRGHSRTDTKLGVLAMCFHPTQPWLFSAGADGIIQLWQDI